jgi:LysM repeat protein
MSVNELKSINNLVNDNLYVGQKLLLTLEDSNKYIVKLGDTLYSIAKRYNIPVSDIIDANNIIDNIILVGQELIIPN